MVVQIVVVKYPTRLSSSIGTLAWEPPSYHGYIPTSVAMSGVTPFAQTPPEQPQPPTVAATWWLDLWVLGSIMRYETAQPSQNASSAQDTTQQSSWFAIDGWMDESGL